MSNQQQTAKFYGNIAKRVFVITQGDSIGSINYETMLFIKNYFNTARNYREFSLDYPVEIKEFKSNALPKINSFKNGDVCLLIGSGRYIDKECYDFAEKCFNNNIPVFFIRSNCIYSDPRTFGKIIWKTTTLAIKENGVTIYHIAPNKYFMEIPDFSDIILSKINTSCYALLPGMVPYL